MRLSTPIALVTVTCLTVVSATEAADSSSNPFSFLWKQQERGYIEQSIDEAMDGKANITSRDRSNSAAHKRGASDAETPGTREVKRDNSSYSTPEERMQARDHAMNDASKISEQVGGGSNYTTIYEEPFKPLDGTGLKSQAWWDKQDIYHDGQLVKEKIVPPAATAPHIHVQPNYRPEDIPKPIPYDRNDRYPQTPEEQLDQQLSGDDSGFSGIGDQLGASEERLDDQNFSGDSYAQGDQGRRAPAYAGNQSTSSYSSSSSTSSSVDVGTVLNVANTLIGAYAAYKGSSLPTMPTSIPSSVPPDCRTSIDSIATISKADRGCLSMHAKYIAPLLR